MFDTLRNNSKIIVYIVVAAFVITGGLMGFGSYMSRNPSNARNTSNFIAEVNGTKIKRQEFLEVLRNQASQASQLSRSQVIPFRSRVLESIIERKLLLNKAEELGIEAEITSGEVQKEIDSILKNNEMTMEQLKDRLEKQNYSMERFRKSLRESLRQSEIIQKTRETSYDNIKVTESEIKERYNQEYKDKENGKKLSEVREKIKESLLQEKQNQAFQNWLEELKNNSEIVIKDPILKGYRALQNENYEVALTNLQEALNNSTSASLYTYLARSYKGLGQEEKAISTFEKAIKEYPDDWELHLNFGNMYEKLEQKDKALTQYDKASDLAGENFMAHLRLYRAYSNIEASDRAQQEMEKLQEIRSKRANQQQQQQETPESIEEQLEKSRENKQSNDKQSNN